MTRKFLAAATVFAVIVVSIAALDANAELVDVIDGDGAADHCPVFDAPDFKCAPAPFYTGPFITRPKAIAPAYGFGDPLPVVAPAPVNTSVPVPPPPPPPPTAPTCTSSSTVMCLVGGRFSARVTWSAAGTSGEAMVVPKPSDNVGNFWIRGPETKEILLRIVDGCDENGNYQVVVVTQTDLRWDLNVTDTQSGAVRRYENELGVASPAILDTQAFATCP